MPVPVQAKVKTDARISFSSPNYHLSAANCLGGGGDDDAGDDNGDQMMTICHRLTYSCNEESCTLERFLRQLYPTRGSGR